MLGCMTRLFAVAQRALALTAAAGMASCTRWRTSQLGRVRKEQGDYRRAIDCMRQIVTSLYEARRHERLSHLPLPAVTVGANLAACHAELGMFTEGRVLGDEASGLLRRWLTPRASTPPLGVGLRALRQGDLPRASLR